jgi:hypothetical protein
MFLARITAIIVVFRARLADAVRYPSPADAFSRMVPEVADEIGDVLTYYRRMNSGEDAEDARFNYDIQANRSLSSNFRRVVELLEHIFSETHDEVNNTSGEPTSERRRRILYIYVLLEEVHRVNKKHIRLAAKHHANRVRVKVECGHAYKRIRLMR